MKPKLQVCYNEKVLAFGPFLWPNYWHVLDHNISKGQCSGIGALASRVHFWNPIGCAPYVGLVGETDQVN